MLYDDHEKQGDEINQLIQNTYNKSKNLQDDKFYTTEGNCYVTSLISKKFKYELISHNDTNIIIVLNGQKINLQYHQPHELSPLEFPQPES